MYENFGLVPNRIHVSRISMVGPKNDYQKKKKRVNALILKLTYDHKLEPFFWGGGGGGAKVQDQVQAEVPAFQNKQM